MPELPESMPEDDSKADVSNSASLYKVYPAYVLQAYIFHINRSITYL